MRADRGHAHEHGVDSGADARWLWAAFALIVAFMAGEVIAGFAAHSLALISDAAHMLTDAASIALVLLAVWLGYFAIRHLISPPSVAGGTVLGVALAGVVVNVAATLLIARAPGRKSLNVSGAFKHIVTDLYAFIATAVAGLLIVLTSFRRADAIATLIVVALMVHAGYGLLRASGRIFLEAAPAGLEPAAVGAAMAVRPFVSEVHDLHIWEITSGMPAASAHVLAAPGSDCHAVRADLEAFLAADYGITHATLQVDHALSADVLPGCAENPGIPSQHQHRCDDAHGPSYRPSGSSSA